MMVQGRQSASRSKSCLQDGESNDIVQAMKTTIDAVGRLVIPKELRREAGLQAGTELEICCRQGPIEIGPASFLVKLKKRGRFLIAIPDPSIEQLTGETVQRTRRQFAFRPLLRGC